MSELDHDEIHNNSTSLDMSQLDHDEIHRNSTSLDMSQLDHDEIGSKFEKRRGMFIIIIPEKLFL